MDGGSLDPAEVSIAEQFGVKRQKTKPKKTEKPSPTNDAVKEETENATTEKSDASVVRVCAFDESVDNHFRAVDTISKLCGEHEEAIDFINDDYIKLLLSRISFCREWRKFIYEPRVMRFANETEITRGSDNCCGINLPQFSSATVPKEVQSEGKESLALSKDFIMYVGGSIWGLDWSPSHEKQKHRITCEFVAVASHPPDSSFHKLGAPQSGPGIVQIWGFPSVVVDEQESMTKKPPKRCQTNKKPTNEPKKPRGRPRKYPLEDTIDKSKNPKGRPRKKLIDESPGNLDSADQSSAALAIQFREDSSELLAIESILASSQEHQIQDFPSVVVDEQDSISKNPSKKCQTSKKETNEPKKPRGRPRKYPLENPLATPKSKGKPRKKLIDESPDNLDSNNQLIPALAIQLREDSSELLALEGVPGSSQEHIVHTEHCKKPKRNTNPKKITLADSLSAPTPKIPGRKRKLNSKLISGNDKDENSLALCSGDENRELTIATDSLSLVTREENIESAMESDSLPLLTVEENRQPVIATDQISVSPHQDGAISNDVIDYGSSEFGSAAVSIPEEVALPRLMLCIAHNGKVAWDVKWRPLNVRDSICKHRMGYLAVLLGDGSLKVWDVPLPRTIKTIFSLSEKEESDPRFVNLEPVFNSTVKCFNRQSIPLTVEWSTFPHNYLLAGFSDGSVAVWKFSPSCSSITNDTRPLLCFNADSSPIRAVAWGPSSSEHGSANIVVTAGHEGVKFWDLRDPYQPLWDLRPSPRFIYSLDWLLDPGCLIVSFDDGTMRLLSLVKAVCDAPVNGKALVGSKQQGFNTYFCTSFAIWSVHISRSTGMVAYCSADGTVKHFQLHPKAVEKSFSRNRTPHFNCGFLTEEESVVTVHTPLLDTPLTATKPEKQENAEAEAQSPDNQTEVIYYNDDPTKSHSKKNPEHDQSPVCVDKVQGRGNGKEESTANIEYLPPKSVAMHRVRWNMNKGSDRWLCYGGAAGIVRCQEIFNS